MRVGSGAMVVGAATAVQYVAGHVELLADRRDRRGGDSFGKSFVVDKGDIEHAQAVVAAGGVEIFAAGLYLQNFRLAERVQNLLADVFAGVFFGVFQHAALLDEFSELVGIGKLVQRAADDGLRLVALGDFDSFQAVFALGHPAVAADEIDEVGALHQQAAP